MGAVVQYVIKETCKVWELRDLRTDGWPLADSPMTPVLLCFAYLFMVKLWGPKFMEGRKPFQLQGVLIAYNALQIVLNAWLFCEFCRWTWFNGYSIICQPMDYSENEGALRLVFMGYCLYISKLIDFLDTLFFVLRKKENQITFLHVFHHTLTPLSVWLGFRYIPGGHSSFYPTCNTLVHTVMYFYYMMAAMGPSVQKYLWWKKYLTVFQMVQFVLLGLHSIQLLFIDCDYPKAYSWGTAIQAVMYFFLFRNYHKGAYGTRPTQQPALSKSDFPCVTTKKHF
ncbi:hypothetical protein GHT06_002295 [Daphnia sinensis]|uniref:Elongation of very long chain fatty acids protein n=1 Tax=Daphnia sinensis TaxID=1820382 RepID=A0AAD5KX46_9CRUS|nr:hypothetical protein GHT06_006403 [Daphnia sinensis]KAI9551270.1 hypothetical protein GHT06_002295 [Daphnia sinensis]